MGSRQVPDGFRRIIQVTDQHRQPFSEEVIIKLVAQLKCTACFPAPDRHITLLLSKDNDLPTIGSIGKALNGRTISCQIHHGGIFNPYLPVRPYDAWDD
ncbi:MAG: hypothetical protein AAB563_02365 [Patescibacteria group bacterium]